MTSAVHASRRTTLPWFRLLSAALLALQLVIACSPLVERLSPTRATAHAHDQGRRHPRTHDESTCAICTARLQVAEAAPAAETVPVVAPVPRTMGAAVERAPSVAPRTLHLSRAPPLTA